MKPSGKMGGQICELRQEADLDSFMLGLLNSDLIVDALYGKRV